MNRQVSLVVALSVSLVLIGCSSSAGDVSTLEDSGSSVADLGADFGLGAQYIDLSDVPQGGRDVALDHVEQRREHWEMMVPASMELTFSENMVVMIEEHYSLVQDCLDDAGWGDMVTVGRAEECISTYSQIRSKL